MKECLLNLVSRKRSTWTCTMVEHNADPLKRRKLNEDKFPSVAKVAKCF